MTEMLQACLFVALFLIITFVSEIDDMSEFTRAFIIAGAGLVVISLYLYVEWKKGRL